MVTAIAEEFIELIDDVTAPACGFLELKEIGVFLLEIPDLLPADHLHEVVEGVERCLDQLFTGEFVVDALQRVRSGKECSG